MTIEYQNFIEYDPVVTNIDCEAQTMDLEITFSNTNGVISSNYDIMITDLAVPAVFITTNTGSGSTLTLTDIPFSDYQIEVLSSEGCRLIGLLPSVQATGVLSLTQEPTTTKPCEGESNGSISIEVISGSVVNYEWNTGATGSGTSIMLSGLSAATYTVTISNVEGCQITQQIVLDSVAVGITAAANNAITCTDATGDIEAIATGGSVPYTYVWDHPNNNNSATLSSVAAGTTYTVTATDVNGCTGEQGLSLNAADAVTLSVLNIAPPSCYLSTDGSAEVSAQGGSNPLASYTFEWSESSDSTSIVFSQSSGPHWVIADDGTCTSDTLFFNIAEGNRYKVDLALSTINPPACDGQTTGFVFIEVTPNIANTTYDFSFPDLGIFNSPSPAQPNVPTGDLRVIIRDSNGCENEDTINIAAPNPIIAAVDSLASVLPVCADDEMATVVIDAQGGTGLLTYEWTNTNSSSNTAVDLGVGIYSVTITDQNGCTAEVDNINITLPNPITANIESFDPRCFGDVGGILVSDASGGSGQNFTYQINTNPTVPVGDTTGIFSGSYTVRVYDSEGCNFESGPIIIPQVAEMTVDLVTEENPIQLGNSTTIKALISNTSPIIDITWSPLEDLVFISNNNTEVEVRPTADRLYEVIVTDENGCTATKDILIKVDRSVGIFVPNVFRTDQTSQNKNMVIFAGAGVAVINSVKIYDRWGSLLKEVNNLMPNINGITIWDGTSDNNVLNSGVYIYILEYTLIGDTDPGFISGDITLLR